MGDRERMIGRNAEINRVDDALAAERWMRDEKGNWIMRSVNALSSPSLYRVRTSGVVSVSQRDGGAHICMYFRVSLCRCIYVCMYCFLLCCEQLCGLRINVFV